MNIEDPDYADHYLFLDLERYAQFYDRLSESVSCFITKGVAGSSLRGFPINLDAYAYSSMEGTLESIKVTLEIGRINDAFALLRKFYDSVVINVYADLYLRDNFSLEEMVVEKIDSWIRGKEKLPEYRIMSEYIKNSQSLRPIGILLWRDSHYKQIRERCNGHVHYRSFFHAVLNDSRIHNQHRVKLLGQFAYDLRDLLVLHLACAFFLNGAYMTSGDYVDFLDCGQQPEKGSELWVAPWVQEMLDQVVKQSRPDLYQVLKATSEMDLK